MKDKITSTIKHPLISGSLIVFIGTGFSSALNFIFNLFMSRNLSLSDYGILASLMSVFSLIMVFASSAAPAIVNFGAGYFAKNDIAHIHGLFTKSTIFFFICGIIVMLFFLLFPAQLGNFFKIQQSYLLILCGLLIFINFITTVNGALLQAKLAFRYIVATTFVSTLFKLGFGILLFFLGFGVAGALWAMMISLIVSYMLSFYPIRFIFTRHSEAINLKVQEIFRYGAPAAIATFAVTSFISTDILLVKHFFSPDIAGIYAGLSLVGRVIFFLTAPIVTVMFPLISQKYAKNESYDGTFLLSLLIVLLPSVAITICYFLFPVFSLEFFIKNKQYLSASSLLGLFGIFVTLYSVLNVFVNFYLSIKKTKVWIPILLAACSQVIFLWFYHTSFVQVITISLIIESVLLMLFIGYYIKIRKNSKKIIVSPQIVMSQIPE